MKNENGGLLAMKKKNHCSRLIRLPITQISVLGTILHGRYRPVFSQKTYTTLPGLLSLRAQKRESIVLLSQQGTRLMCLATCCRGSFLQDRAVVLKTILQDGSRDLIA